MKSIPFCLLLLSAFFIISCGEKGSLLNPQNEKTRIRLTASDETRRLMLLIEKTGEYDHTTLKTFMREVEGGPLIEVRFPWIDSAGKQVYNRFVPPYYLQISVVGITKKGFADTSNIIEITHPESNPISFTAFHVAHSINLKKLYFFDRIGSVGLYDLGTFKLLKTVNVGAQISYGNVGFNGSATELYVPGRDGNLYIYNGATLDFIDKISVGYPCYSVVAEKGLLFVATSQQGFGVKPIKVYNRSTKTLVGTAGTNADARLFNIPGIPTNPAIYEVTTNVSPGQVYIHYFLGDGQFANTIAGDKRFDFAQNRMVAGVISNFKLIVSSAGMVYNRTNMVQENSLSPFPNKFRAFYFKENTNQLYAARMEEKVTDRYAYPGFNIVSSFQTAYMPEWIFNVDGKPLSVGTKNGMFDPDPTKNFYLEFLE